MISMRIGKPRHQDKEHHLLLKAKGTATKPFDGGVLTARGMNNRRRGTQQHQFFFSSVPRAFSDGRRRKEKKRKTEKGGGGMVG
jgi:hypothetical protein